MTALSVVFAAALAPQARAQAPAPTGQSPAPTPYTASPGGRPLYADGQGGRFLLNQGWAYRADPGDQGFGQHFELDQGRDGWVPTSIPFTWNAKDTTQDEPSIGWFRTTFTTPATGRWRLRFESVNYHVTVWLNGRVIGHHDGGYVPFEIEANTVKGRTNRLVLRVDSHHPVDDLAFWNFDPETHQSAAGWWNFGGILREVSLYRVDHVRFDDVATTPRVACNASRCSADIVLRARVAQASRRGSQVRLRVDIDGQRIMFGPRWVGPGAMRVISTRIRIARPRAWSPESPYLYRMVVRATVDDPVTRGQPVATYITHVGLRTVSKSPAGTVLINGKPVLLHGASIHEDDPRVGAAWGPAEWKRTITLLRRLHANVVRAHYPLGPGFLELCDRAGILVWDEVPVYQVPNQNFDASPFLRTRGVDLVRDMVNRDHNHASVITYSVGNEMPSFISNGQRAYIGEAISAIRKIDRSRFVALDRFPERTYADYSVLRRLDFFGLNEYFGWYSGAPDDTATYLDQLHALFPSQGIVVTENGAEANRDGPVTEKGSYYFQREYVHHQLQLIAGRPYVSGAIIWALRDFRVNPRWTGGNPKPSPPWNKKGLVGQDGTTFKPAFWDVANVYAGIHGGAWPSGFALARARPRASLRGGSPAGAPSGGFVPGP